MNLNIGLRRLYNAEHIEKDRKHKIDGDIRISDVYTSTIAKGKKY